MKTKDNVLKGIIIGISVIVLPLILMSSSTSTSNNGVVYGTPESHVWELKMMDVGEKHYRYMFNKVTGEVREISKKGYNKLPLE